MWRHLARPGGTKTAGSGTEGRGLLIHLQAAEEAFGIALAEAMAAGCIVLASRVGAYPELIRNGYDGFLIDGNHSSSETLANAARLILNLTCSGDLAAIIST